MNEIKAMKIKTRKLSIERKIAFSAIGIGLLLSAFLGMIVYSTMSNHLISSAKNKTLAIAESAALILDGDAHETLKEGDENTDTYNAIWNQLNAFYQDENIAFVYTFEAYNDDYAKFVIDTDPDPSIRANIGDEYIMDKAMVTAFSGASAVTKDPSTDEFGTFYSAYAPLYNSKGDVIAIVGADYSLATLQNQLSSLMLKFTCSAIVGVAIMIIICFLFARSIGRNLFKLNEKMQDVLYSDGDLTKKLVVTSGDELEVVSKNINALIEQMRNIVAQTQGSSRKIKDSTDFFTDQMKHTVTSISEVSATMEEMSATMEETSASLEQTQDSITSVTKSVDEIKEKSLRGYYLTEEIEKRASDLKKDAANTQAIIKNKTNEIETILHDKVEQSKSVVQISTLSDTILQIASQTSLLALNASIESARAGESGRGFAVVADGISKLASSSAETAKEIQIVSASVINSVDELAKVSLDMIQFMNNNVMQDYEKLVKTGDNYYEDSVTVRDLMNVFKTQAENLQVIMQGINNSIYAISLATVESTKGVISVATIATEIDADTKNMREETLKNQKEAEDMNSIVSRFKVV